MTRKSRLMVSLVTALVVAAGWWWYERDVAHFLVETTGRHAYTVQAPPAANSPETRKELDELLAIQAARTKADVEAARADRKTRIERFYGALGIDEADAPSLPKLRRLARRVEDDVRIHVRVSKKAFRRMRPYVIESRLEPCIGDVQDDLAYPSGHAAFAWAMVGMLKLMVPEKADVLERRGEEFARQRMVCGVHFRSDLAAGKYMAETMIEEMSRFTGAAARRLAGC
jgi:acid phosphatase (class A)